MLFSPCVPVGGAGCALLGGLKLKLSLTVLWIGVDRVEFRHPVKREVDRVEILHSNACILRRSPSVACIRR